MSSGETPKPPPRVYRAMKRDPLDGLPVVGETNSTELGVRPIGDINVDLEGNIILDGGGMSVAPSWRLLPFSRIPRRLRHVVPGAAGANTTACFSMGVGPFLRHPLADGPELIPDAEPPPATHGVIAPLEPISLADYQRKLANTRSFWQVDET